MPRFRVEVEVPTYKWAIVIVESEDEHKASELAEQAAKVGKIYDWLDAVDDVGDPEVVSVNPSDWRDRDKPPDIIQQDADI